jgi:SAM-dependent methyltransferase
MNNSVNTFFNDLREIDKFGERINSVTAATYQIVKLKLTEIRRGQSDLRSAAASIDLDRLEAIRKKHSGERSYDTKWLRTDLHLLKNLRRAFRLDLMQARRLNILDIGAGPGYFCFLCEHFGHNATALDVDDHPLFNDLIEFFGIQRVVHRIEEFKYLPKFERRFDLVTGFLTVFNKPHQQGQAWGAPEWNFFLDDLAANVLKKDGTAFFVLNSRFDDRHYTMAETDLFLRKGGKVVGRNVIFRNLCH